MLFLLGFRSESKIILEGDARSTSSLSYDDIDEVVQAQPMNTEATTAGASGQNYIHEDVLHQEAGKFYSHVMHTETPTAIR